ncbi:MAG: hypothetical protein HYT88_03865 [Candidatus Omnitrophica bacterium]|nr:hypothetical protein [Candidatus Omnitrophota bacterium]
MGPLMACLATGGVSGVRLVVKSASPPLAGLSASSAALIATLYGLNCLGIFQVRLGSKELVLLAHRIESSLHTCGLQDLAAAVFGGVHAWRWKLTNPYEPFEGTSLVSGDDCRILDDVFCVAYLGSAHDDADATSSRVSAFLSGQGRRHWFDIIRCVHEYAKALEERDWKKAGLCMNRELELRKKCGGLLPLTQQMEAMIEAARTFSCGARHTGRGGGGCVWAIGMPQAIAATRARWQDLCWKIPGAKLLDVRASAKGVCCIRGENVQY